MSTSQQVRRRPDYRSFGAVLLSTAADGRSEIHDLGGNAAAAVEVSSGWTAAPIMFRAGRSTDTPMQPVFTSTGGRVTLEASTERIVAFDPDLLRGLRYVQIESGDSTTAVAQAAPRTLYVYSVPLL